MELIPYIRDFAGSPLDTPRMRAELARLLRKRLLEKAASEAARRAWRASRPPEPMDAEARARLERARRRTPHFMIQERNRLAKARERARRLAEDPEGYRRERREEMREWRANRRHSERGETDAPSRRGEGPSPLEARAPVSPADFLEASGWQSV